MGKHVEALHTVRVHRLELGMQAYFFLVLLTHTFVFSKYTKISIISRTLFLRNSAKSPYYRVQTYIRARGNGTQRRTEEAAGSIPQTHRNGNPSSFCQLTSSFLRAAVTLGSLLLTSFLMPSTFMVFRDQKNGRRHEHARAHPKGRRKQKRKSQPHGTDTRRWVGGGVKRVFQGLARGRGTTKNETIYFPPETKKQGGSAAYIGAQQTSSRVHAQAGDALGSPKPGGRARLEAGDRYNTTCSVPPPHG